MSDGRARASPLASDARGLAAPPQQGRLLPRPPHGFWAELAESRGVAQARLAQGASFRPVSRPPTNWASRRKRPDAARSRPAVSACRASWSARTRSSTHDDPKRGRTCPQEEAALLDFLRRGGRTSELAPDETIRRLLAMLREPGRFDRLLKVAATEPPRVRAMLGAIGEALGKPPRACARLRASLNPLSRYDFGVLGAMPEAARWQAKGEAAMRLFEHRDFEQAILQAAEHFRGAGSAAGDHREGLLRHRSPAHHRRRSRRQGDLQGRHEPLERLEPDPAVFGRHRHLPRSPGVRAAAGQERDRPRAEAPARRDWRASRA